MKTLAVSRRFASFVALLLLPCVVTGQTTDQNAITSARLIDLPPPNFYIDILFTNDLANPNVDLSSTNVRLRTVPDPLTPPLAIDTISLLGGTPNGVRVTFSSSPPSSISSMQVCFSDITFLESSGSRQTVSNVCSPVQVLTLDTAVAEKSKLADALAAVPKTKSEKNIFASGFVTTASSGTQGGVDLNLNSNDLGIKGMTASLQTIKTSVAGGDPQNFEVGLNFQNAYVFGGHDLDKIRDDLAILRDSTNPNRPAASKDYASRLQSIQNRILSAVLVNFSGRLEGGVTSFNVVNYVGDGEVALQSGTKTLFGSRKGFWQFRLVPFGVEGGKNVQESLSTGTMGGTGSGSSGSASGEDTLARLKAGGTFSLFYDNPQSLLPFKRVELNLGTVQRYLFLKEAEILSANSTPVFRDGHRPWYEANLLMYLAEAPSGRYGFRLTYSNGSLPPSFAVTKSFQFGFVYETADDSKKKK